MHPLTLSVREPHLMLMQTGWIQASHRVTRRLACDPTCLPLSLSLPIKNKQNLQILKSRRQYNLFLENYPAFKGLSYNLSTVTTAIITVKWLIKTVVSAAERTIINITFKQRMKYLL